MILFVVASCTNYRARTVRVPVPNQLSAASFTSEQSAAGRQEYKINCAACHGENMEGAAGPALAGPKAKVLWTKMHATVGEISSVIVKEMPLNAPGSLTQDQYVEIVSYILQNNGYQPDGKPLTFNVAIRSHAPLVPQERN